MPGFDGKGPMGAGPMTGGRRGLCNPATARYNVPRSLGGYGRGLGCGFRGGFGFGMRGAFGRGAFWGNLPEDAAYMEAPVDEVSMLKTQADSLKNTLDRIHNRIVALEKSASRQRGAEKTDD